MLGIRYPIFQGGMAWISDGKLAGAVSEAGGLGIISAMNANAEYLREQIKIARELTDKPFGVNIMLMSPFADEVAKVVAEEKVAVVTTGAGNPSKYMKDWLAAGIKVIPVVASVSMARLMQRVGACAVIAEGGESGGHIGETTTMALVPQVTSAVTIPVIAAGGIASAEQVNALLAMGAAGVSVGTALLTTAESSACDAHRYYAEFGTACDTVLTRIYNGRLSRVLRNALVEALDDWELMTAGYPAQKALMGPLDRCASEVGRNDLVMLPLGQSAGRSAYRRTADCVHALFPRRAD